MPSVLSRAAGARLETQPFPHLVVEGALDPPLYQELVSSFPPLEVVSGHAPPWRNNFAYLLSAHEVIQHPMVSERWRTFFAHHVSHDFWREALELVAAPLLALHPDLPRLAGKPLESFVAAPRRGPESAAADVLLDCQFAINSPVSEASTVRTAHIDRPNKLFNALLYCPVPGDPTPGGELDAFRFIGRPAFLSGRQAAPSRIEVAKTVPYAANTLFLFLNSERSVHGVRPRPATPYVRRYLNFMAESRVPLFRVPELGRVGRLVERATTALRGRRSYSSPPSVLRG